jgi:hypothetical protein
MDIGTGIFLSSLVLGAVGLFVATKDRWNWKKIFLWPLTVIVVVSAIISAGNYAHDTYKARLIDPEKETSLWGISLQATPADVKFAKGEPTSMDENTWVYVLDAGAKENGSYIVRFKDGKVRFIIFDGSPLHAPTVSGVSPYIDLSGVEALLGKPSNVSHSNDELKRLYSFDQFNFVVGFAKNQIYGLGIYDPTSGPLKFKEDSK